MNEVIETMDFFVCNGKNLEEKRRLQRDTEFVFNQCTFYALIDLFNDFC